MWIHENIAHLSQPLLLSWNILSTKFNTGMLKFGGVHCKERVTEQKFRKNQNAKIREMVKQTQEHIFQ